MIKQMWQQLRSAFILLLLLTAIMGLVYPSIITGIAQLCFPWRANGSLIERQGQIVGSALIGQSFTQAKYFWGRPSATNPFPYNGASSAATNYGPTNPKFIADVKKRIAVLRKANPNARGAIPADLVTSSGSGLDPHITPLAALYQVPRVARARHLAIEEVEAFVKKAVQPRSFGLLGEPTVNVVELNLALDHWQNSLH